MEKEGKREGDGEQMELRKYRPRDCEEMARLFYDTVHTVNAADYTKEQLDAWAPAGGPDLAAWDESFRAHLTLIAELDGKLAGFGDMDTACGYLDRLYVHKDFQGRGVATALCGALEQAAREADLLCMDSTYPTDDFLDKAKEYGHATCPEAGRLAAKAGVRRLWLTHYSAAVTDPAEGLAAARAFFPGAEAGCDGMQTRLNFDQDS